MLVAKNCDNGTFDVYSNEEFVSNFIVYNLNQELEHYVNISNEMPDIPKGLSKEDLLDLDRFSLKIASDGHIQDRIVERKNSRGMFLSYIEEEIYFRIYKNLEK